jgi:hypothetical protein
MTYSFSKLKISKSGFSIDVYRNVSSNRKFYDSSFHSTKFKISEILKNIYSCCCITRDQIFAAEEDFKDDTKELVLFLQDLFTDLDLDLDYDLAFTKNLLKDLGLDQNLDLYALDLDFDDLKTRNAAIRTAIKILEKIGKKTVWETVSENGFDNYHHYSWTRKDAVEHVRDYVC